MRWMFAILSAVTGILTMGNMSFASVAPNEAGLYVRALIKPKSTYSQFVKILPMSAERKAEIFKYLEENKLVDRDLFMPELLPGNEIKFHGDRISFQVLGVHKIQVGKTVLTMSNKTSFKEFLDQVRSAGKMSAQNDFLKAILPFAEAQDSPSADPQGGLGAAVTATTTQELKINEEAAKVAGALTENGSLRELECKDGRVKRVSYSFKGNEYEWSFKYKKYDSEFKLHFERLVLNEASICATEYINAKEDYKPTTCKGPINKEQADWRVFRSGLGLENQCCAIGKDCTTLVDKAIEAHEPATPTPSGGDSSK